MVAMTAGTLTSEELAALDAQYEGIPSFGEWAQALGRPDVWERHLAELIEMKEIVSPEVLAKALDVTVRAAAFDTGAIEGLYPTDRGLTITVAKEAALWEHAVEERAPNGLAFFEAQLKTYELVLDAATKRYPVSEAWIRRLHEELTAPQEMYTVQTSVGPQEQPLPRGEYRRHPNHFRVADGTVHAYAPVDRTRPEMSGSSAS